MNVNMAGYLGNKSDMIVHHLATMVPNCKIYYVKKENKTWFVPNTLKEAIKENKKNILTGFDAAAESLGNTRAVCHSYYVHPKVIETYESGEIVPYFKKVNEDKEPVYTQLSETEKAIYKLIKDYKIEIED